MQPSAFELREGLEEYRDKGMDILRGVFRCLNHFSIVRIREANSHTAEKECRL